MLAAADDDQIVIALLGEVEQTLGWIGVSDATAYATWGDGDLSPG